MTDNDLDDAETLVDLLDRVLDVGVVLVGDVRISVANVDLLYVGLKLVLGSTDKIEGLIGRSATAAEGAS